MSTHKYFDKICCAVLALALVITILFMNAGNIGITSIDKALGYETRLFDTSKVHTVNIVMDDWDDFISTCTNEEYAVCSVIIDNEAYKNVAIRAKGNTSLSQVQSYGNDRYSFKIEFDHYDSTTTYFGLDKLSLNNIIQDNTYMKDYLCYQLMREAGADAPLCSYVQVLVNGEEWGLYLAIEGVEESFLQRNYGNDYGELYKPDSISMGGGVGNGGKFDMNDWREENGFGDTGQNTDAEQQPTQGETESETKDGSGNMQRPAQQDGQNTPQMPENQNGGTFPGMQGGEMPDMGNMPQMPNGEQGDGAMPEMPDGEMPDMQQMPNGGGGNMGGMGGRGGNDVSLIYTDDEYDSYSNIFNNAKTDITDSDKDRLIASLKQLNENTNIEDVVDVEAVIRYFVAHNFTVNYDSYTGSMIHNYYLYEKDGKLSMLPWDYNLAFGGFQGGSDATSAVNFPIDTPVSGGTVDSRPMLAWIFESEEYTALYHQCFAELIESYFTSGKFEAEIDTVKAMIAPYVESDPTRFCTYEEFESGIDTLKEFCLLRAESIEGQLNGTIPATSDGQSADSSALIDASDISISAMGSMGGGGNMSDGGMQPNFPNHNTQHGNEANENTAGDSDGFVRFPNSEKGDGAVPEKPDMENMPQMPGGEQGGQLPNQGNTEGRKDGNTVSGSMPNADMQGDKGNRPEMNSDTQSQSQPQESSTATVVTLIISVVVLIGSLVFALFYKRKGY